VPAARRNTLRLNWVVARLGSSQNVPHPMMILPYPSFDRG